MSEEKPEWVDAFEQMVLARTKGLKSTNTRLKRERDEALAEVNRLREHLKELYAAYRAAVEQASWWDLGDDD